MKKRNRELMEEVIESKLEVVLDPEANEDDKKAAFGEAMAVVDRQNEVDKTKTSNKEVIVKYALQGGTFIASLIVAPLIKAKIDDYFADKIIKFEKDDTVTTTVGKGLFRSLTSFKSKD